MNHVYRLVWSRRLGAPMAVAETAGAGGKRGTPRTRGGAASRRLAAAIALALGAGPMGALALPSGGSVVAGHAGISASGKTMTVRQTSGRSVIDWKKFSVAPGERVDFRQPGSSAATLNRVTGNDPSRIYGHISANGQVFLVNRNGVFFAKSARVDAAGLAASTLGISNRDFMAGRNRFSGDSTASVVNKGRLSAFRGGYVALISRVVDNKGQVVAPGGTAALGAGARVDMTLSGNHLLHFRVSGAALAAQIDNGGAIVADGGRVLLTAQAKNALLRDVVNNTGVVRARGVASHGGVIDIEGGGSGTTRVAGTLDASPSAPGGAPGHIETSGHHLTVAGASVTAGQGGQWVLDPVDLNIGTTAAKSIEGSLNAGTSVTEKTTASAAQGAGTTNSAGVGDININAPIAFSGNATLTLSAYHSVNVNADISASGANSGVNISFNNAGVSGSTGTLAFSGASSITLSGSNATFSLNGTPYTVLQNMSDLQSMSNDLTGNYVLGQDVTDTNTSAPGFAPVGTASSPFQGRLNGLGHTVNDLLIAFPGSSNAGLFGVIGSAGSVRNLRFKAGQVKTYNSNVGVLAGSNRGSVSNVVSSNASISATTNVGGLVGINSGHITNSDTSGTVNADKDVGGLAGKNTGSIMRSSSASAVGWGSDIGGLVGVNWGTMGADHATGSVLSSNSNSNGGAGGLVGVNQDAATISNSWASGDVSTHSYNYAYASNFGGLVGANDGQIHYSHASGSVTAGANIGGLVGNNTNGKFPAFNQSAGNGTVDHSYATGNVQGLGQVGGFVGNNGYSTLSNDYATGSVSTIPTAYMNTNFGGFVGEDNGGLITNSFATGDVGGASTGSNLGFGGFAGYMGNAAVISQSYSTGNVVTGGANSNYDMGGFVGSNYGGTLREVYETGNVSVSNASVSNYGFGGLVGISSNITISNAYAMGNVRATGAVGGIIGSNSGSSRVSTAINQVYVTGNISGNSNVGMMIGYGSGPILIQNAFWDAATATTSAVVGGGSANTSNVGWIAGGKMFASSNYPSFNFTTQPGLGGNNWVIVDTDGSLNNAGGAAGGTTPMMSWEYSTQIRNGHQLQLVDMAPGASYTLRRSISLSATKNPSGEQADVWGPGGFVPIAGAQNATIYNSRSFTGTFDGGGFTASGLYEHYVGSQSLSRVGLFGHIGSGGSVGNLSLRGANVSGVNYAGALAGTNSGLVSNASVSGTVVGKNDVGGLIGKNSNGAISNSYATDNVQASGADAGGLVGYSIGGKINVAYAMGNVGAGSVDAGGLVGYDESVISNAYATGIVTGSNDVGGLVGISTSGTSSARISDAYAAGRVVATNGSDAGGLAGVAGGSSLSNAYWDTASTGKSSAIGARLGGVSTNSVKGLGSNAALRQSSYAGFDFSTPVWRQYDKHTMPLLEYWLKPLTISAGNITQTYTGSPSTRQLASPTYSIAGASNSAHLDGGAQPYSDAVAVGTYEPNLWSDQQGFDISYAGAQLTINGKQLKISASISGNPTKVYDGGTSIHLGSGNFTLSGFTSGQGATVSPVTGQFGSANAGNNVPVSATLSASDFTADPGTKLSNYILPTSASGTGTIRPRPVTAQSVAATNKVYDGSAVDNLNLSGASLGAGPSGGVVAGDSVALGSGVGAGTFSNANAGSNVSVTSHLKLTGASSGNYTLIQPTGLSANIRPRGVTVNGVAATNKVYDGTAADNLNLSGASLGAGPNGGVVSGDSVALGSGVGAGTFSNANAGSNVSVTSHLTLTGASSGNYTLIQPTGLSANINPKNLQIRPARIVGDPSKTYDGSNAVHLASSNFQVGGFVAGQGATVSPVTGQFASANAGQSVSVSAKLSPSDFTADPGTKLSNYVLPNAALGSGTIRRKALGTASITGNPSKVYDGGTGMRLASSNFKVSGFVGEQGATVSPVTGQFGSANAGNNVPVSATLSASDFTPAPATRLSNYILPTTASGTGTIRPRPVTAQGVAATDKVYDGTAADNLNLSGASLGAGPNGGVVSGDSISLGSGVGAGTFSNANAGSNVSVASHLKLTGAQAGNYTLIQPTGLSANIRPREIAANGVAATNKVYDGNAVDNLNLSGASLGAGPNGGVVAGDSVSLGSGVGAGTFSRAAVGGHIPVTAHLSLIGTQAGDYTLAQPGGLSAAIDPKPISVSGVRATPKVFDGNVTDNLNISGAKLHGIVPGDSVSLGSGAAAGEFASPQVGSNVPVSAHLGLTGADAGNYRLVPPSGLSARIAASSASSPLRGGGSAPVTQVTEKVGAPSDPSAGDTDTARSKGVAVAVSKGGVSASPEQCVVGVVFNPFAPTTHRLICSPHPHH